MRTAGTREGWLDLIARIHADSVDHGVEYTLDALGVAAVEHGVASGVGGGDLYCCGGVTFTYLLANVARRDVGPVTRVTAAPLTVAGIAAVSLGAWLTASRLLLGCATGARGRSR